MAISTSEKKEDSWNNNKGANFAKRLINCKHVYTPNNRGKINN